jgi:5-methylcytosine-specific restriction protein A
MTERREFAAKTKLAAWQRSGGKCEECGRKVGAGLKFEYDHTIPCEIDGTNDLDNCRVLCVGCHAIKTGTVDIPRAAKNRRIAADNAGVKTRRSRPMPGTKASGLRKRMKGTVERRDRD